MVKRFAFAAALAAAVGALAQAQAPSLAEIVGAWDMTINAMGREFSVTLFVEDKGGQPALKISSPQGTQEADGAKYENGVLSWNFKMGPADLNLSVSFQGDTFTGKSPTPFGDVELAGKKLTAEELAKRASKFDALKGSWTVYASQDDKQFESEMRFETRDGELIAIITQSGMDVELDRVMLRDGVLRWEYPLPYSSNSAVEAEVKLGDGTFEGTAKSDVLGEVKLKGQIVDTTKLVQAAYDDPKPVLGDWEVETDIDGVKGTAKLKLYTEGPDARLHATIQSEAGELKSEAVEFEKVGDAMAAVTIHVKIPDAGENPLQFELIVNGDTFEGEEVTLPDSEFYVSGKKVQ